MTPSELRRQIDRALFYTGGTHTVDDVLLMCERGQMQLWRGEHSVVMTQILEYPRLKELCVFLAAGRMDEMMRLAPIIEAFGREKRCARMVFAGRPGWARSFLTRERGWVSKMVVFEKEL